ADDRAGEVGMQALNEEQTSPILAAWRNTCAHVSGGALGSTVEVLEGHGALAEIAAALAPLSVDALAQRSGLDRAYAHLAVQLLARQGLAGVADVGTVAARVALTDEGRAWARHAAAYDGFSTLLDDALTLRAALAGAGEPPPIGAAGRTARARAA